MILDRTTAIAKSECWRMPWRVARRGEDDRPSLYVRLSIHEMRTLAVTGHVQIPEMAA